MRVQEEVPLNLELAGLYMDVVPKAMREYRNEMRKSRTAGLTVPQFRILAQLLQEPANNRGLAEHQGVSVAAMSRMVDALCRNGFVKRSEKAHDRRHVYLQLTAMGRRRFERFRAEAGRRLQERLAILSGADKRALKEALATLSHALKNLHDIGDSGESI